MNYEIIDPKEFIAGDMFREDEFLSRAEQFDWPKFQGKMVLVRGCSTMVPPWIYMLITSKLSPFAKSIRYGNEHDNVVIFRAPRTSDAIFVDAE
jgi:hypothetical protein